MNKLNHSPMLAARFLDAAILLALAGIASSALAAVHYVDLNSTNATPPYLSWALAATNIQNAVDSAVAGDEIVVTNGTYATGGRFYGRVGVDKPLSLRSVNGPQSTIIDGGGEVRCAYLTDGASLSGFTLTNGRTLSSDQMTLFGAGVNGGTLTNCILSGNRHDGEYETGRVVGGGAFNATLYNCTLTGNSAMDGGGGAADCTLYNCVLAGNSAPGNWHFFGYGGGGGGALNCNLYSCILTNNSTHGLFWPGVGGGAYGGTLNNCTLSANSADDGGGAAYCALNNCIIYFNTANYGANYAWGTLNYCCTTPQPNNGIGNILLDPQLASAVHLSAASPCRAAGNASYVTGRDIDGKSWANPPSIGCDQYYSGARTGPLNVAGSAAFTNLPVGLGVQLTASIEGLTTGSSWDFADGTSATNQPYTVHVWSVPGDYSVFLRAYNDNLPDGIASRLVIHVVPQPVHYVSIVSVNPVAPYTSWTTAATTIQDAVDATTLPGELVLVTNGTYATGQFVVSGVTNRVAVSNHVFLRSVNGPRFTIIDGQASVRCASLADGATLSGFTLTNGTAKRAPLLLEGNGGGVACDTPAEVVSNCVIIGNSASSGGGVYGGTLNHCLLSGNSSFDFNGGGAENCTLNDCILKGNSASTGGGAAQCTLNNCTLTGNLASSSGGGVYASILNNCIVYFNSASPGAASPGANYDDSSRLNHCCTTPQPTNSADNIALAPLFVNRAAGDLRLQPNSPCINAGLNMFAPPGPDLEGNERIVGGTVDIGAYEFQSPQSLISYAWLQQYNLPTDGSGDFTDPDGDGLNNWQEWRCGTNPTNALSGLRMLPPVTGGTTVTVTWQSVVGVTYFLERRTSLAGSAAFASLATNIPGQPGTTTYADTNAIGAGPWFYRVGVSAP